MKFRKIILSCLVISLFLATFVILPENKAQAAGASFFLSPSSNQVTVGATVSAKIMVSTDTAINAGEGSVSFSSDILDYQSVSTSGSIFSFWTSGPTGSATGVSFGGGLSNPGYSGSGGTILTITWKAKSEGTATISVSGSKILANDGSGTNIYSSSSGGEITVGPVGSSTSTGTVKASSQVTTVNSSSHPDQNAWYSQKKVELGWSAKSAQGYSFGLNQSATATPDSALTTSTSKSYDITSDGVWYFHIRAKFSSGFGPVTHFKIQVDTAPPDPFNININQEGGITNPSPSLTFEAKDVTSGIDHYEAIIDGGAAVRIVSGDKLPKQKPGDHKVVIRAFDKAGNGRDSEGSYHIQGISAPDIISYDKIVGLLQGITFTGSCQPEDTIVIYLGNDEVARFKASDYQISEKDLGLNGFKVFAASSDKIYWRYTLNKQLMPGTYFFKISRIDKNGAESEPSEIIKVSVVASTIRLAGHTYPTIWLILLLLAVIAGLCVVIVVLIKKIKKLRATGGKLFGIPIGRTKKIIDETEEKIKIDIDKTIPEYEISAGTVRDVKKRLKHEVEEAIEQSKEELSNDK